MLLLLTCVTLPLGWILQAILNMWHSYFLTSSCLLIAPNILISYHIVITIKTILYYLYYNVMQYINLMIIFLIQDFIVPVTDWYSIKLIFSSKSIKKKLWTNEIYIYINLIIIFLIQNIIVTLTDWYPNKLIIIFIRPIKPTYIK